MVRQAGFKKDKIEAHLPCELVAQLLSTMVVRFISQEHVWLVLNIITEGMDGYKSCVFVQNDEHHFEIRLKWTLTL